VWSRLPRTGNSVTGERRRIREDGRIESFKFFSEVLSTSLQMMANKIPLPRKGTAATALGNETVL
jgi:hypothetical protein